MLVRYYSFLPGRGMGNLYWTSLHPMRGGKFPKAHPCHENPAPTVFSRSGQPATDDPLGQFRARGYLATCFPEGDGIAFEPPEGKATPEIVRDVEECFGWKVKVERA